MPAEPLSPTERLEELARQLSPAQRRAVLTDDRGFALGHKGKWAFMTNPTAKKLHELGLIEAPRSLCFPTELGLKVRDHLRALATQGTGHD